jgi:hypothetical protein
VSIESISSVGTLEAFQRLVQNARVRNGGFEVPVNRTVRTDASAGAQKSLRMKAAGSFAHPTRSSMDSISRKPESSRQVLGTQFDSYA